MEQQERGRILDLFCGAGGAAMGLYRAGFDVVGVDIKPQPHYPSFHDAEYASHFEFHQADALTYPLEGFDAYWASPPCQGYSIMLNLPWLRGREYPKLIVPVRERLTASGKPFIIENVAGARYRTAFPEGLKAGWLCGGMFGLPFYRHRYFETDFFWMAPGHPRHELTVRNGRTSGSRARDIVAVGRHKGLPSVNGAQREGCGYGHAAGVALVRLAMDIDWMSREEITQAIPPAYSEFLGKYLLEAVKNGIR